MGKLLKKNVFPKVMKIVRLGCYLPRTVGLLAVRLDLTKF